MRATWVVLALLACSVKTAYADEPAPPPPAPPPAAAPAAAPAPATPAPAGDQTGEAQKYYEAGRQAFAAGQFVVAISAFEEAYNRAPRTSVKFSLAMAYRAQYFIDQDKAKVRRAVSLFRAVVEETPQGELREKAAGHLAELSPVVMRLDDADRARNAATAPAPDTSTPAGAAEAAATDKRTPPPAPPEPTPPPAAAKTQLMVSSRTPGAHAAIDADALADAPVIKEIAPGKHKVRVELDGYFPQEVEGVAVEGRFIVVEVNLEPRPALLGVVAPAGAEISIDGKPLGEAPLGRAVELPAGNHQVVVLASGHRAFSQDVTLGRGEKKSVTAKLDKTGQRKASYFVLGLAGAAAIAGGVTTFFALSAQSDAQDIESKIDHGTNITPAEVDEHARLVDRRDAFQSASYVLYGSAFVIATTGLFLYLVDQPHAEAMQGTSGPVVTPTIQKDQFTVSLVTRF